MWTSWSLESATFWAFWGRRSEFRPPNLILSSSLAYARRPPSPTPPPGSPLWRSIHKMVGFHCSRCVQATIQLPSSLPEIEHDHLVKLSQKGEAKSSKALWASEYITRGNHHVEPFWLQNLNWLPLIDMEPDREFLEDNVPVKGTRANQPQNGTDSENTPRCWNHGSVSFFGDPKNGGVPFGFPEKTTPKTVSIQKRHPWGCVFLIRRPPKWWFCFWFP